MKTITGKNYLTLEGNQHCKGKRVIRHEHRKECYHGKEKMFTSVQNTSNQGRYIKRWEKEGMSSMENTLTYGKATSYINKQKEIKVSFYPLTPRRILIEVTHRFSSWGWGVKHDSLDQRITEKPWHVSRYPCVLATTAWTGLHLANCVCQTAVWYSATYIVPLKYAPRVTPQQTQQGSHAVDFRIYILNF